MNGRPRYDGADPGTVRRRPAEVGPRSAPRERGIGQPGENRRRSFRCLSWVACTLERRPVLWGFLKWTPTGVVASIVAAPFTAEIGISGFVPPYLAARHADTSAVPAPG